MCVEWLKANGPKHAHSLPVVPEPPKPAPPARDLFGNPLPEVVSTPATPRPSTPLAPTTRATDAMRAVDIDQLRGSATDEIEGFKALGVEVLRHSETYGDVSLVPAYTGQPRKELTPEDAATLARVLSVFPGSHIVLLEKANPNNPERQERPSRRS